MLIKHSKRTVRKGCKKCGSTELYWAHDTDQAVGQSYCETCDAPGRYVLIDKNGNRHRCGGEKARVEAPKQEPEPEVIIPKPGRPYLKKFGFDEYDFGTKLESGTDLFPRTFEEFKQAVDNSFSSQESKIEKKDEDVPILAIEPKAVPIITGDANDKFAEAASDKFAALDALEALQTLLAPKIDKAEVERIAREVISDVVYPIKTVVVKDGVKREVEGTTHAQLSDVITAVMAGEHVMMVGPAGTGKSTIAEQAAEALGLDSYSISLSPQTPASQIIGYMQAQGEYVETLFRRAYEHGGLFHFDEVDNAHPSVLAVINSALANGHMAFPDSMVKRHDDFRVVASANTYGRGATRAYVGRQAIDAATLDRFTMITIEIDEALEAALVAATGVDKSLQTRILRQVRKMRENADKHALNVVVSPRASIGMARLLVAGMTWEAASDARLKRGLDEATWKKLIG